MVAVVAVVGAVIWGAFAFLGWRAHLEDFPRLTPPDAVVLSVTDTGSRIVYLEHDRSAAPLTVPTVTVTGPAGAQVPLAAYEGDLRYDVPGSTGRIGEAVLTFEADEPGPYRVSVADAEPGTVVAVGDSLVWGWALQVAGIVALLLGGLLVAFVLVLVTAARRAGSAPA